MSDLSGVGGVTVGVRVIQENGIGGLGDSGDDSHHCLSKKVDVKVGFDSSFKIAAQVVAVGKVELIIHCIEQA